MKKFSITRAYRDHKVLVTAHRGFSGRYPENTMSAFREALKLGVDFLEFDLRATKDNVPIVLHDPTIDRTSNGTGSPSDYSLEELRLFNFSCWDGSHTGDGKGHLDKPACEHMPIPTFEDVLKEVGGKAGLNIQVYDASENNLIKICELYKKYDLYDQGYLSLGTFAEAERAHEIDSNIEVCVLDRSRIPDRDFLNECIEHNCRIIQPLAKDVTPESCRLFREMGVFANTFFSNTDQDNRRFIECGIHGIMTDYPDILIATIQDMKLT